MGVWAEMLLNDFIFAAATADLNIPNDFIKYLDIMPRTILSGSTPVQAAATKGAIPSIIVKLGGTRIASLSYADLLALNSLWMHRNPLISQSLSVTAGGLAAIGPARLWLYIQKLQREMSAQFGWAAVANGTDQTLDVKYTYKDTPFPERGNLHYVYETFNGVGAAAARIDISRVGARLIGILTFSTSAGTGSTIALSEPEVSELDVIVDNRLVYHDNWFTRGDETAPHSSSDSGVIATPNVVGLQHEHYSWISFEEEPWLADKIWAVVHNTAHLAGLLHPAVGVFRLICVYVEP
jgi:hypothetical protein